MNPLLKMNEKDNVATCLQEIKAGQALSLESNIIVANSPIPQYHKIALCSMAIGTPIYKYGQVIGLATAEIIVGDHVHIHNIESTRGRGDKKEVLA